MFAPGRSVAALVPVLALLTGATSCTGGHEGALASLPEAPALSAAPMQTTVAGTTLTLDAHAWRDMMPGDPPQGLSVQATLRSVGGPIPAGVTMDRAYVVRDDRVWETPFTDEKCPSGPSFQERMARDGPMWGDMRRVERVDVIVRIRPPDGTAVYLSTRGEGIAMPQ
jgi:hypothetical protein